MIKCAICDDNREELSRTRSNCMAYFTKYPEHDIRISTFDDPSHLLELKVGFDIMILDIYMPNVTGIELATYMRMKNDSCEIIFLTSSERHAIQAFSLNATDYIVKPYVKNQFELALDKAVIQLKKRKYAQIILKSAVGFHKILFADFLYAETQKHIQNIHLTDGSVLKIRMTSIELFEKLSYDRRFYKCGSTYIVNLEKIKEVTARIIMLDNEERLHMPRGQYKPLSDRYILFSIKGY